jgi:hypothetical protein
MPSRILVDAATDPPIASLKAAADTGDGRNSNSIAKTRASNLVAKLKLQHLETAIRSFEDSKREGWGIVGSPGVSEEF